MDAQIIALATLFAFTSPLTSVISYTGQELHQACASKVVHENGVCLGFIVGVIHAERLATVQDPERATLARRKPTICPGENVTNGRARNLVVKWLKENPERRDMSAATIVLSVLEKTFPCD